MGTAGRWWCLQTQAFLPSGGTSHGAVLVCCNRSPLLWHSSRQQLTTSSTAESELEGFLLATSVADFWQTKWGDFNLGAEELTTSRPSKCLLDPSAHGAPGTYV